MEVAPTEKDYRAWLAFLWTGLTFLFAIIAVLKNFTPEQIATILGPILTLDGVFIISYFPRKNNGT